MEQLSLNITKKLLKLSVSVPLRHKHGGLHYDVKQV